jgi:hypothetical protein
MNQIPADKLDEINEHLFAGNILLAIKIYRELTGLGLKESKDFIDKLEIELRKQVPEKFKYPPGQYGSLNPLGCLVIVAVIAAFVGLLFVLLN